MISEELNGPNIITKPLGVDEPSPCHTPVTLKKTKKVLDKLYCIKYNWMQQKTIKYNSGGKYYEFL